MNDFRFLAILAHPDDESLGMGATLAKYAAEGVEVQLVCATRGEKGWNGAPSGYPDPAGLGAIREAELRDAASELGINAITFLDAIDGELAQTDGAQMLERLVRVVREVRPQVVVTFGPEGDYGHPDHIAICQLAAGALICAADPACCADDLSPHRVDKFYYLVNSPQLHEILNRYQIASGIEVDGLRREMVSWPDWAITTRIADLEPYWPQAKRAILRHRSQLPSLGDVEAMPDEIWREILLAQDAFYRVYSIPQTPPGLETDFFTGLR